MARALEITHDKWSEIFPGDPAPEQERFRRILAGPSNTERLWKMGRVLRAVELECKEQPRACASGLVALLAGGAYTDFAAVAAIEFMNDPATDGAAGGFAHRLCGGSIERPAGTPESAEDLEQFQVPCIADTLPQQYAPEFAPDFDRWLTDPGSVRAFGVDDDSTFVQAYNMWSEQPTFNSIPPLFQQPVLTFSELRPRMRHYDLIVRAGIRQLEGALATARNRRLGRPEAYDQPSSFFIQANAFNERLPPPAFDEFEGAITIEALLRDADVDVHSQRLETAPQS